MVAFTRKIKSLFQSSDQDQPVVIARHHHKVSRKLISAAALKVLYRLNKAGYAAYLVGGGVRDLLLKRKPKDFDIATDARPEEVRKLFRNSRLIGRRFRLVHVQFYDETIEVSTFRAGVSSDTNSDEVTTMVTSDNTYGSIEEDAWRRDFTVNALYYNIEDFSVVDYTGGMQDIKKNMIRMIGDPEQRYREDPVRLLRALRLSAKLNFEIEKKTEAALIELPDLLEQVSPARLFDEILKMFFKGHSVQTYKQLDRYNYLHALFPQTADALKERNSATDRTLIKLALRATDSRFSQGQSLNPGFLMAVLLWPAVLLQLKREQSKHTRYYQVLHSAIENVIKTQNETFYISKRLQSMMRNVWIQQYHLVNRRGKRIYRTLMHRYFRAAYDFLELRVKSGEKEFEEPYLWWKRFQSVKSTEQHAMMDKLVQKKQKKKK